MNTCSLRWQTHLSSEYPVTPYRAVIRALRAGKSTFRPAKGVAIEIQ